MNKSVFDKGTKRKCGSCSTLFYDFNKSPIICPNCGAEVSFLTNVSKRGRPPKVAKVENVEEKKSELNIDDLDVEIDSNSEDITIEDPIEDEADDVEGIVAIPEDENNQQ